MRKKFKKLPLVFWVILITLCFGAFQLPFSGFMADDFMQLGVLEGVSPFKWWGPLDLYTLSDGVPEHMRELKDEGAFQWFWDPSFKLKFFRPLSSLLLILDHFIFGLNPVGYGIHNILWLLLFMIPVCFLIQRFLPGKMGMIAVFIFVLSGIHWLVSYWTASRHIVIAASLGMWSFMAYIKFREDEWEKGYMLSIFLFIIALFAGETALAIVPFIFVFELTATSQTLKKKLIKLLPFMVMVVTYLSVYRFLGYGGSYGSGYLNPFLEPLQFLLALPERFFVFAGSMFLGGHTDLWLIKSVRPFLIISCFIIIIIVGILFKRIYKFLSLKERVFLKWILAGSSISIIIFSTANPGVRLLIIPFIGGSVLISAVLYFWWTAIRKPAGLKIILFRIACWILICIHFIFAPIQRFAGPIFAKNMFSDRLESAMNNAEFNHYPMPHKLVFLTVPDFSIGLHSYYFRKFRRDPMPESWWVLSWENCAHRVHRSGDNVIELELIGGGIKNSFLRAGTKIEMSGMDVFVRKTNSSGACYMEFRFDRSADDDSIRFLSWQEGKLKNIQLPGVGESILITAKK